jgi:spore coat protein U-like protein
MFKKIALLAVACVPVFAATANATDINNNLNVTATIAASCVVTVGPTMDFGSLVSTAAASNAASNVQVACSNGTPYTIGINDGQNVGRRMSDGAGNFLDYEIYRDAGRTQAFFNIALSAVGGTGTGVANNVQYDFYGQIPSQTTPTNGVYNDQVVVTVRY